MRCQSDKWICCVMRNDFLNSVINTKHLTMACRAETCNTLTLSTVKVELWLTVLAPSFCMLTNSHSFFLHLSGISYIKLIDCTYTVRATRKSTISRPKYEHFLLLHTKRIQIQVTDRQNRPPHCCLFSFFSGRKQVKILYRGSNRWENNEIFFTGARNSLTARGAEGGVRYVQMCGSSGFECGQKIAESSNVHISEVWTANITLSFVHK
jgi:hypothetical protein